MSNDLPQNTDHSGDSVDTASSVDDKNTDLDTVTESETKENVSQEEHSASELQEYAGNGDSHKTKQPQPDETGILIKIRNMTIYDIIINVSLIVLLVIALTFYLSSWTVVESPETDRYYVVSGVESVEELESAASNNREIIFIQEDRSYAVASIESVTGNDSVIITSTTTDTQTNEIQLQSIRGVVEYKFERVISIQKITDYLQRKIA